MATKTIVTCDVCGKEPATTIVVAVGTATGEVDVCERHAKELTATVKPYMEAGRGRGRTKTAATKTAAKKTAAKKATKKTAPVTTAVKRRASKAPKTTKGARRSSGVAAMRAWGLDNGFDVATRGRLKPELVTAYRAAHPRAAKA